MSINAVRLFLYGAGRNGIQAFYFLRDKGYESIIYGFIDNGKADEKCCGKFIYSYEETKNRLKETDTVIVTPDMEVSSCIYEDLKKNGIKRILFWNDIERMTVEELDEWINKSDSFEILSFSQESIISVFRNQAYFLATHASAVNMKPADGELRKHQLDLINLAVDFQQRIEGLGINPYLEGGNLLGFIRHNGFIPWDDDMDMTLIRGEYEKLKNCCKEIMAYEKYSGPANNYAIYKWTDFELSKHFGEMIAIETPLRLRIHRSHSNSSWRDQAFIDIIPIDSYNTSRTYEEHLKYLDEIKRELDTIDDAEEQYKLLEKKLEEDKKYQIVNGNYMYFGLDSLEGYFNRNKIWHRRTNIFPLKKVMFEGQEFLIPNNEVEYIKAEFGDGIMELPSNAALHIHRRML